MKRVILLGGGGHAKVCAALIQSISNLRLQGYTDFTDRGPLLGSPYLGKDEALQDSTSHATDCALAIGVGQVGLGVQRSRVWQNVVDLQRELLTIISPHAVLAGTQKVGAGCTIMTGAALGVDCALGVGVIVNTNSTVEHDVRLGDWTHIGPGATVCGQVEVGAFSMVGAGATVIEGVKIPSMTFVAAGATVIHSITEPGIYAGCPARKIRSL